MAARKTKKKARPGRGKGAKLGKRCPKPGVMVATRAGLIGVTTGSCDRRRVRVALMGAGEKVYTRSELRKVPKGQQARIQKELGRGAPVRAPVKRTPRSYAEMEREAMRLAPRPMPMEPLYTAQSRYMDGF